MTPLERRQLGTALRAHREAANLTLADVAQHFGWSTSKPSRIEGGKSEATARDVRDLLDLYEVTDDSERAHLIRLTQGSRGSDDSYYQFTDLLPRQFTNFLGLEAAASVLRMHDPVLVPGLFQTEEYARALITAYRIDDDPETIERWVQTRMTRQELLSADHTPEIWAILGEGALRCNIGGDAVMAAQNRHLLHLAKQKRVRLQVVPFRAGAYIGMDTGFVILDFVDAPSVVTVDGLTRNSYLHHKNEVDRYSVAFDHMRAVALSRADSRALIEEMAT